jgi:hypothetical protein
MMIDYDERVSHLFRWLATDRNAPPCKDLALDEKMRLFINGNVLPFRSRDIFRSGMPFVNLSRIAFFANCHKKKSLESV